MTPDDKSDEQITVTVYRADALALTLGALDAAMRREDPELQGASIMRLRRTLRAALDSGPRPEGENGPPKRATTSEEAA